MYFLQKRIYDGWKEIPSPMVSDPSSSVEMQINKAR